MFSMSIPARPQPSVGFRWRILRSDLSDTFQAACQFWLQPWIPALEDRYLIENNDKEKLVGSTLTLASTARI
jgi:hypothetical protein